MEARDTLPHEDVLHLTSLKEVFGGFAHEIAQPLHTIMIASQVCQLKLARTGLPEEEKLFLAQRLNIVTSQVQRATGIIESLRAFSRGTLEQQDAGDIGLVFRHVQGLMAQQFVGRGIELTCHMHDPLPPAKEKTQLLEGIIVQGLAYARDAVSALDDWHRRNTIDYKKSVTVNISGKNSLIMNISWIPGEKSSLESLPDASRRPGLMAAASALKSVGGGIEADHSGLLIHFP
ncbi:MAG: hypothetical protein HY912_12225 [Desulfomonile tiedjei]|uniref:histidine kinase n=1 Tax=Desulfomonile tiedjei TaxID=2358 RepID=A0A9D6V1R4_9BACT|nr:hypothetical protein [Desulfomonile tiedjei]